MIIRVFQDSQKDEILEENKNHLDEFKANNDDPEVGFQFFAKIFFKKVESWKKIKITQMNSRQIMMTHKLDFNFLLKILKINIY